MQNIISCRENELGMEMDVLLCQKTPVPGKPMDNVASISYVLSNMREDMAIFPEMFLTGYGSEFDVGSVTESIEKIVSLIEHTGKAVVFGAPHITDEGVSNGLVMITPERTFWYDKIHLANFGIYSEESFIPGNEPVIGRFMGMRFGLSMCYDVFFPELFREYSTTGANMNICISASAVSSKRYFDTVLPARALENVNYLAFVNNIGDVGGLDMHGCSRAYDPLGTVIATCGNTETSCSVHIDTKLIEESRKERHHLDDFRNDIPWFSDRLL